MSAAALAALASPPPGPKPALPPRLTEGFPEPEVVEAEEAAFEKRPDDRLAYCTEAQQRNEHPSFELLTRGPPFSKYFLLSVSVPFPFYLFVERGVRRSKGPATPLQGKSVGQGQPLTVR